jgi:hypothetical protein
MIPLITDQPCNSALNVDHQRIIERKMKQVDRPYSQFGLRTVIVRWRPFGRMKRLSSKRPPGRASSPMTTTCAANKPSRFSACR